MLDTILAVPFMLPATLSLTAVPSATWHLPATQQQTLPWAWAEVQCHPPSRCSCPSPHSRAPATQPTCLGPAPPLTSTPCGPGAGAGFSGARTIHGLAYWLQGKEPLMPAEQQPPLPLGEPPTHWPHHGVSTHGHATRSQGAGHLSPGSTT